MYHISSSCNFHGKLGVSLLLDLFQLCDLIHHHDIFDCIFCLGRRTAEKRSLRADEDGDGDEDEDEVEDKIRVDVEGPLARSAYNLTGRVAQ